MLRWPNFEKSIRRKEILARGRSYYQNGQIQDTQFLKRGKFRCIIESENDDVEYSVKIKILNNKVTKYNCNCPYTQSTVCKHIIAALLDIRDNFSNQIEVDDNEEEKEYDEEADENEDDENEDDENEDEEEDEDENEDENEDEDKDYEERKSSRNNYDDDPIIFKQLMISSEIIANETDKSN